VLSLERLGEIVHPNQEITKPFGIKMFPLYIYKNISKFITPAITEPLKRRTTGNHNEL